MQEGTEGKKEGRAGQEGINDNNEEMPRRKKGQGRKKGQEEGIKGNKEDRARRKKWQEGHNMARKKGQ